MLKLERKKNSRELAVFIRTKTAFFTRPFLFALAYALFIHLLGFLIFHVAPFKISYQQGILSPTSVFTEIPIHSSVYTSHEYLDKEIPIPNDLIAPMPTKPKLLTAETWTLIQNDLHLRNQIEKHIGFPLLPPRSPTITLHLSGPIAEIPFSLQKNELLILSPPDSPSILKFHYFIEVEQQSGQIFRWKLVKIENNKYEETEKTLQKDVQKILQSLQFTLAPTQIVLSGQLEIMIAFGKPHD